MLQSFSIIITNAAQKKSYYFDIINSKKNWGMKPILNTVKMTYF